MRLIGQEQAKAEQQRAAREQRIKRGDLDEAERRALAAVTSRVPERLVPPRLLSVFRYAQP